MPVGSSEAAISIGVAVSVALGLAGAALGWRGLGRVDSDPSGGRTLALAALIVGLTGAGLHMLVVIEAYERAGAPEEQLAELRGRRDAALRPKSRWRR